MCKHKQKAKSRNPLFASFPPLPKCRLSYLPPASAALSRLRFFVLERLEPDKVVNIGQLLQGQLSKPRPVVVETMAQRAELGVGCFSYFCREAIEDLFVLLQAWEANLLAPFAGMSTRVEIINDKIEVSQTASEGRISALPNAHGFEVTSVIMDNAPQGRQPLRTLCGEVVTL